MSETPQTEESPEIEDAAADSSEGRREEGEDGASGDRPDHPAEGTYPPGNPDVDPQRMDEALEDQERTKPY